VNLIDFQKAMQDGASVAALVASSIARAQAADVLNAFITTDFDNAASKARQTSYDASAPLKGIPFAHKDLFCTQGLRTTSGSKMLASFIPPYSASIVERLDQSGAICIGKASMDEFAMGSSNAHSAFGAVNNPWDLNRVPGGSSGGSAALVAARVVPFATASDTGGSIRQPAAFCGVTGIKPTYGRVSRFGMIAYASSLDQAGVIAQSAHDCASVLQVMAGFDSRDGTSLHDEVPNYVQALSQSLDGRKIGLPRQIFDIARDGLDSDLLKVVQEALKEFERAGAKLVPIDLPYLDEALAAYYVIAPAEASSNLSRFDGVRYGYRCENPKSLSDLYVRSRSEGFGSEVQKRILLGTYALSAGYFDAYYLRAQKVRRLIANAYNEAFKQVDLIAMPTTPTVAFEHSAANDPMAEKLADIFTVGVNLAGLPAISMPVGFSQAMPVGMQLIGPRLSESALLSASHQFQLRTNYHEQAPACFASAKHSTQTQGAAL
jgi:aspartyl-tRNA(Asn)/glutamyl-tRNA(Gln) amidotransferase subunit A